jgi:hypothetical protein
MEEVNQESTESINLCDGTDEHMEGLYQSDTFNHETEDEQLQYEALANVEVMPHKSLFNQTIEAQLWSDENTI